MRNQCRESITCESIELGSSCDAVDLIDTIAGTAELYLDAPRRDRSTAASSGTDSAKVSILPIARLRSVIMDLDLSALPTQPVPLIAIINLAPLRLLDSRVRTVSRLRLGS